MIQAICNNHEFIKVEQSSNSTDATKIVYQCKYCGVLRLEPLEAEAEKQGDKTIPKISILNNVLTISISAEDLQFVVENNPATTFKVIDREMFLNHFAANLEEYQSSNAVELGVSELQIFFDKIIEETYTNGSEAIIDTEENNQP